MKKTLKMESFDTSYICNTFGFLVAFVSLRNLTEALGLYTLLKDRVYVPVKEGAVYGFF